MRTSNKCTCGLEFPRTNAGFLQILFRFQDKVPLKTFKFNNDAWVEKFKHKHDIRQRKITKLVSRKEAISIEKTSASADIFRVLTLRLIPDYNKNYANFR